MILLQYVQIFYSSFFTHSLFSTNSIDLHIIVLKYMLMKFEDIVSVSMIAQVILHEKFQKG